jgi:hypothetical protein
MSEENKQPDNNDNVVITLFPSKESAEEAIDGLKMWDKANHNMKLGVIGTISKDGDQIATHVGRKAGKGMALGATLGVIGAVLTGGLSLIGTAVATGALGGALGAFFKKSMNLTKEEIAQIGEALDAGNVAVVVTCDDFEIPWVTEFMQGSGGTVRSYAVPQEALAEAAASPEVMDKVVEGTV